jgi:hypothetical protein
LLGITSAASVLKSNRFSGVSFPIQLSAASPRVLYVGSITRRKVAKDLEVLAEMPAPYEVEARLHPSLIDIPLPGRIRVSKEIEGSYNSVVYADTSMVFQFECDRSKLIFLDHPDMLNQDPAAFLNDWPGRTIRANGGSEGMGRELISVLGRFSTAS